MSEILPYLLLFSVIVLVGYAADYFRKIYLLFLELKQESIILQQRVSEVCSQQRYIIELADRVVTQDPDRTGKLMAILKEIEDKRLEGAGDE